MIWYNIVLNTIKDKQTNKNVVRTTVFQKWQECLMLEKQMSLLNLQMRHRWRLMSDCWFQTCPFLCAISDCVDLTTHKPFLLLSRPWKINATEIAQSGYTNQPNSSQHMKSGTANHHSAVVDCIIFPNFSLLPGFMSFDIFFQFCVTKGIYFPAPDVGWDMQIAWANSRKEEMTVSIPSLHLKKKTCVFPLVLCLQCCHEENIPSLNAGPKNVWRAIWGRAVPANWSWAPSINLDTRNAELPAKPKLDQIKT